MRADGGGFVAFSNSALGKCLGAALIIAAPVFLLDSCITSCTEQSTACTEHGGSWDGGNARCNMPEGAR